MTQPPEQSPRPPSSRGDALAVVRRLREAGHVAYFAGGCVRDALLGLQPKDYDVATDAPPARVRELFPRTQAVGAAFGVILVRQGRSQIEVATFRSEGRYLDGRRPENVTFTTAEEDAKRRDFTINGLFYDPIADAVIDHVGGRADLESRLLRAIGEPGERFAEDHLRLLRAVRFAARFGLTVEPSTGDAIAQNAPHLARISPERIAEELRAILTPPTRARGWQMLQHYGLDDVVFRFFRRPEPDRPSEVSKGLESIFDRVLPGARIPFGLALAAAALEYAIAGRRPPAGWPDLSVRRMVQAARQALRISNDEAEMMEGSLQGLEHLLRTSTQTVAMLKRFLARPTAALSRALLSALPPELAGNREELEAGLGALERTDFAPPPLITGDDLTAAGLAPGRVFKKVLDDVYDAQLEGRVNDKAEALELALRIARGEG
jgi:poly(A) polymerase